jgi:6-phosphofructokinase 1
MARTIGVLTSGGDCAGLNAALRAVVRRAHGLNLRVLGIRQGTAGLMARPPQALPLDLSHTSHMMLLAGGTILGTTNSGNPFAFPMPDGTVADRSNEVIEGYRQLGLYALIGIGGDGSFAINDVGHTESAVGHTTAVAVVTEALDRLQPTAASHSRVMVLEVMGRDAGHIAIAAGIAGGADVVLIPEIPWRIEAVTKKIQAVKAEGRNFALVVVAEAVTTDHGQQVTVGAAEGQKRYGGVGHRVGDVIREHTGAEVRVTVLGHVQRGGTPIAQDRLIAAAFGVHAVDLVAEGKFDRMVGWWNRRVVDVPFEKVVARPRTVDPDGTMVRTARGLGICLGDR